LFDKDSRPVVAISRLQDSNTKLRSAIGAPAFDEEIPNAIGTEEIADDHFGLYLTVGVTFIRKTYIYPIVQKLSKLAGVTRAHGIGDFVKRIERAERNQDQR
jgi:hypothetical protein